MNFEKLQSRLGVIAAGSLLSLALVLPADAFWSRRNLEPFNPDANPPRNYDPASVGYGGAGGQATPSDCYWSREQIFIRGRLTWRPLKMCPYSED